MPYPKRPYPVKKVTLRLPEQLHLALLALNIDPSTGRPRYGTFATHVSRILQAHIDAQKVTPP